MRKRYHDQQRDSEDDGENDHAGPPQARAMLTGNRGRSEALGFGSP
jgi:hypothetical protein